MSKAVIITIDALGDINLAGEDLLTLNTPSDYHQSDIAVENTYEASACMIEEAVVIKRTSQRAMFTTYGERLDFCNTKLLEIFGEVPKEIWLKEV